MTCTGFITRINIALFPEEVVDLQRGPLSLVRITEELLQWKSNGSGLENRD
jgi:hypothetical protein